MTEARWSGQYHIVNLETRESLESHDKESTARYFCRAVNDHEEQNGRSTRYAVEMHGVSWRRDA